MNKLIKNAGIFSVFLLIVIGTYAYLGRNDDQPVGPVVVALVEANEELSFRGLHATDDTVVAVGGNKGVFGMSLNGGFHWIFTQIPGADSSNFRSVYAHDAQRFTLVSAGAPSYIYRTTNGGSHWERTFVDTAAATFLDAVVFADDSLGWVFGDPVDGYFKLLQTVDGGATWVEARGPEAIDGEAGFAASGSAMCYANDTLFIASGGTVARLHYSADSGATWSARPLTLNQGMPSQGAFALDVHSGTITVVGGDYMLDSNEVNTVVQGSVKQLEAPFFALPYCSDVSYNAAGHRLFVGTRGVYLFDGSLQQLDTTAMHAAVFTGDRWILSGPGGRVGTVFSGTHLELEQFTDRITRAKH